MSVIGSNVLAGASGSAVAGYEIERSLRFNSSDSAYLSRVPSLAGNRNTWTWSGWVKRSGLSRSYDELFGNAGAGSAATTIFFQNSDQLIFQAQSGTYQVVTDQVFRDTSAWYHIVAVADTTNATSTDRLRLYVNGSRISSFSSTAYPTQNFDTFINQSGVAHYLGRMFTNTYFDGYLADIHFIDGQALAPTDFGEYDDNNVWQPKEYSGTYGTNGFHLPFSDNSTAAALGTDTSGNSNTWTVNNISVTAGASNDSLVDSPTNGTQTDTGAGNEVVGNYCTLNPLDNATTLSNGNLTITGSGSAFKGVRSTIGMSSGKWYMECTMTAYSSSTSSAPGIWNGDDTDLNTGAGSYGNAYLFVTDYASNYRIYVNKGASNPYSEAGSISAGDIIGIALDLDNGECYVNINGTYLNSGSSVYSTWPADTYYFGGYEYTTGNQLDFNFGQRAFAYTAPSGFKALCTTNLTNPTIADGSTAMDATLYTGNGINGRAITGLNFAPDFVWVKGRNAAAGHVLQDIVRGAGNTVLASHTTAAEGSETYGQISSFDSAGFTVTSGSTSDENINFLNRTYVAWTWDGGSSTVSNTDGSITSQVRANASAGFSIVTYTGNGSAGATVGHGLGVAPQMILLKTRNAARNWTVGHQGIASDPWTDYLTLNSTAAAADLNTVWNDTAPTSSVFTVGTANGVNGNTETHVAYCFAPVDGYSSFGSYTGNGSTDGPFVYTGFRPKLVIIKYSSTSGTDWLIYDSERDTYNVIDATLYPNYSYAETNTDALDFTSNGFKIRASNTRINTSTGTYIYAAFASHPFKYSRAR